MNTDCLEWLSQRPSASVNCIVTSPPYWGLRDYGATSLIWASDTLSANNAGHPAPCCVHSWQCSTGSQDQAGTPNENISAFCLGCGAWHGPLGLEPTPELYVQHLTAIFRECRRALTPDGTLWLNLGDCYARSPAKGGSGTPNGRNGYGEGYAGAFRPIPQGLKPKDLIGIPWRIAFALQADGWYLRSDVIWEKPDVLPESVKDRPTKSHEYLFLLTKSPRYYYDADAVREIGADGGLRNKRTIWRLPKARLNAQEFGIDHVQHFAMFPPELALPCVLAGCPEGGVVLDPFAGSASTGVTCLRAAGTKSVYFIGLEINPGYAELGKARLAFEAAKTTGWKEG